MAGIPRLSEAQFLEIEAALGATEKGRAFLAMSAERRQLVSVATVRQALRQEMQDQRAPLVGNAEQMHIQILRQELREMSSCIQQTRNEIAALRPTDAGSNRIMAATGELDAIVSATERATSAILSSAERIQDAADKLPDLEATGHLRREIETEVTEILMACSFQDITGQRTTKVVNTLRYLEQRVNAMIEIWGLEGTELIAPQSHEPVDKRPDAHLLNGPALDGGVSQADVDALLAGLEPALNGAPAASVTPPAKPVASAPSPPAAGPPPNGSAAASQSEIDALFD